MVGLALKDQGIDVVAVGNGEAAVRKISDIHPDLVLADVFMPVRNGYEVCQYVKTDPSLTHIPVILLVGAFDPLDEQEAQRVGADGVLKKPFVPPDPLISMVKSALQRAGVTHGSVSAAKTPEPDVLKGTDLLTPSGAVVPTVDSFPSTGSTGGAKDWRAGSFEQILAKKTAVDSWEPVDDKPELVETAPAASNVVTEAPTAPTTIPKATPVTGTISAAPFANDAWAAASSLVSQEKISTETATAVEEVKQAKRREPSSPEAVVAGVPEAKQAEPPTKTPKEPWFSVPSNPWNAEIEKANKLASAWDATAPVATPPAANNGTEKAAEPVSETTQKVIDEAALPAAAVGAIRREAAQVAGEAPQTTEQQATEGASFYAPEALIETPVPAPEATPSMDDLVARVLARMNPEVLQAVTREILKPVVEAMVKEEMKSKKS